MQETREILALLFAAVLPALGCAAPAVPDLSRPAVPTGALRVERGPLVLRHVLSGEVEAESAVPFVAPNVGQWPIQIQRLPETGTFVHEGEIVVEFDSSQLAANLDNQRMAVLRAEAELESTRLRTTSAVAERELELRRRRAALDKAEVAAAVPAELQSEREYELLRLELERARLEESEARAALESGERAAAAEVAIQEVALEKARRELRYSEEALERLRILAPRDGVVVIGYNDREDRIYQESDTAQPGDVVARLPDLRTLRIRAFLFDVDDGALRRDMSAKVTLDAYPDESWRATVRAVQQIAQQPNGRSARRVFEVLLDLDAIDPERMRPGMSAKVEVEQSIGAGDDPLPLLAPREALAFVATVRELAGAGPSLAAGSHANRAKLHLAGGGALDVEVRACSPTLCIVEGVPEGQLLVRSPGA